MKATLFLVVASIMITTPLDAMNFSKTKKSPTEKCWDGIRFREPQKVANAIKKGADVNCIIKYPDGHQRNFLQLAIDTKNILTINALLNAPMIDINRYPPHSMPVLHCAVFSGNLGIVQLFLNHPKTDINILDSDGCTSLFAALDSILPSSKQIACELLSKNIDTNIPNNKGNTILHNICQRSSCAWIESILNTKNPPLNAQNNEGDTPLHIACRMNAYCTIKPLLASHHVINFKLCNNSKKSAFDIALDSEYDKIISLFFDTNPKEIIRIYRKDKRLFAHAVRANQLRLLKQLLPSPHVKDTKNWTPLIAASERGYTDMVELLLKQKNCNHLQKRNDGRIALHCASENGRLACIKKLLEHDDNLDYRSNNGNTALHLACANKHIHIIDYLVEKGANTLIKGEDYSIPFMLVYSKKLQDKIKSITLHRMLHAKDHKNNTLFHMYAAICIPRDPLCYDNYLEFLITKGLAIYARNNAQLTALDIINDSFGNFPLSSQMALSFWRVTSDHMQYDILREILKRLPKDVSTYILLFYYRLNINTILAKIVKNKPTLLSEYKSHLVRNILEQLPNDFHLFPLLYRPVVFSYE